MAEIEVKTDILEKFEEVKLHSDGAQIIKVNQNNVKDELGNSSIEIPAPEQLKRNSLSKFFRFKGLKSSVSKENINEVSKSNSLFRIFGKKLKKKNSSSKLEQTEKHSISSRNLSMRSLVNCQNLLPWIGHRKSQANLHEPSDENAKSDVEDENNDEIEIATCSEIF
jgi:hypothetical protein